VGSEGTLGVITEITLKIYPQPESIMAAVCNFSRIADAVNSTIQIIQMGVPIARCEFLDTNTVRAVNRYDKLSLKEGPMLLMEFHGSPAGVQEQVATVQEITKDHHGEDFQWAETPEARSKLWQARHNAYFAGLQLKPGCRTVTTDTCVPISRLADCMLDTLSEADASGLPHYVVGHVGDGNFHVGYLIDPHKPEERELAERLNSQLVARALRLGGTCTGEHGIGLHKQEFLVQETGAEAVAMMRAVKQALDPDNIMNPGKIFATTA
jgi:D-lactate dehydrogenase (cytochrome)